MFGRKRKRLTSHERAIAITHLSTRINNIKDHIKKYPEYDSSGFEHDIECLKKTIVYLGGTYFEDEYSNRKK